MDDLGVAPSILELLHMDPHGSIQSHPNFWHGMTMPLCADHGMTRAKPSQVARQSALEGRKPSGQFSNSRGGRCWTFDTCAVIFMTFPRFEFQLFLRIFSSSHLHIFSPSPSRSLFFSSLSLSCPLALCHPLSPSFSFLFRLRAVLRRHNEMATFRTKWGSTVFFFFFFCEFAWSC